MWMRMRANHPRGTRTNQLRLLWVELSLSRELRHSREAQHARELRHSREAQHARELRHSRELQHAREPQRSRETTWDVDLRQRMRMAWLNHITLVKFYLISFFENLSGQNAWKDAVYKNAEEIFAIFAQYYPASAMQRFRKLFMEHLRLTDEVAAGLKADPAFSGAAMENWYINAEEIASFLSRQTPAYNETELRKMFYDHLDMERQQMEAYLDGDYETDIEIYLRSQQNMIELADFLTSGLLAR